MAERGHGAGGGGDIASSEEGRDRLIQGLSRVDRSSGLESCVAESGERFGPIRMPAGSECEGPLEVRQRRGSVQPECPFSGQSEEPQRGRLQIVRLLDLSRRLCEFEGRCVVVGENIGEVLNPIGSLGLDPGGRGDVARGPRGPRELRVGNVSREDVPKRILRFTLE